MDNLRFLEIARVLVRFGHIAGLIMRQFADSLRVFAAPKRIGLKSCLRLSALVVRLSSITLPDASTHFRLA